MRLAAVGKGRVRAVRSRAAAAAGLARPAPRARAAALAAAGLVLLAGCAGGSGGAPPGPGPRTRAASPETASPVSSSPAVTPSPAPSPSGPAVISVPWPPGRLHQTQARPDARTAVFRAEMTDLWAAIVTGKARLARQAFFPLPAYTQIKAIYDAAGDWHDRLWYDFRLDVAAAHRYLGRGARRAKLVRVIVPAAEAAWIVPGVCDNSGGYWHVGGARVVYRQHGQVRSIGIASLISWRGRWYVVHFGAVLRPASYGVVDAPASGPGVPGPAGGC